MAQIRKGTTYSTGDQVTASNLNAHVDSAILLPGAITEQPLGTAASTDYILAVDTSLKKVQVSQLQTGGIKADGSVAMTGELQLSSSTPSAALKAASKGYVDATVAPVSTAATAAQTTADQALTKANQALSGSTLPVGSVVMWPISKVSNTPNTFPTGWVQCNGGTIPAEYTSLIQLLGTTMAPIITIPYMPEPFNLRFAYIIKAT